MSSGREWIVDEETAGRFLMFTSNCISSRDHSYRQYASRSTVQQPQPVKSTQVNEYTDTKTKANSSQRSNLNDITGNFYQFVRTMKDTGTNRCLSRTQLPQHAPLLNSTTSVEPKPAIKTKFNHSEEPISNGSSAVFAMRRGGMGKGDRRKQTQIQKEGRRRETGQRRQQ